jgi:ribonuclease HI
MTIEIKAMTKALFWFKKTFTNAWFLSNSMSILRMIETGWRL